MNEKIFVVVNFQDLQTILSWFIKADSGSSFVSTEAKDTYYEIDSEKMKKLSSEQKEADQTHNELLKSLGVKECNLKDIPLTIKHVLIQAIQVSFLHFAHEVTMTWRKFLNFVRRILTVQSLLIH